MDSNAQSTCISCLKPKTTHSCERCKGTLCRKCLQINPSNCFSYMTKIPADLSYHNYCPFCYDAVVAPALVDYEATLEKAKDVYFLTRNYPGYIPVVRKANKDVRVDACPDRREAILRMAFQAAEQGFNAIIDAEVEAYKTGGGRYFASLVRGRATPADVNGEHLERASLRRV